MQRLTGNLHETARMIGTHSTESLRRTKELAAEWFRASGHNENELKLFMWEVEHAFKSSHMWIA